MKHDLQHTMALLARTPAALNALLRDLPEAWTLGNEGGSTWNATEVVAHSPTPSRQSTPARSKGLGKKAEAAGA